MALSQFSSIMCNNDTDDGLTDDQQLGVVQGRGRGGRRSHTSTA